MTIDSRMTLVLEQKPVSAQRVAGPASTLRALTALVELAQRRDCVGQLVAFSSFPMRRPRWGTAKHRFPAVSVRTAVVGPTPIAMASLPACLDRQFERM